MTVPVRLIQLQHNSSAIAYAPALSLFFGKLTSVQLPTDLGKYAADERLPSAGFL